MLLHHRRLIPSQWSPCRLGQGGFRARDGLAHGLGAMPGQCRNVFARTPSPCLSMRGSCSSIVNRVARSTRVPIALLESKDEIPLSVPRYGLGICLRSPIADLHLVGYIQLSSPAASRTRRAKGSLRSQARRHLSPQRAAAMDIERLVDGLMAALRRVIVRIVALQPLRY
ncbi:MAG: hypothetical protein JWQ72_195 [Polaromonas sp.]|nr:hypothetical protein [Polaromonas sp.]